MYVCMYVWGGAGDSPTAHSLQGRDRAVTLIFRFFGEELVDAVSQSEVWIGVHTQIHATTGMCVCIYLTAACSFSRNIAVHVAGADSRDRFRCKACSIIFKQLVPFLLGLLAMIKCSICSYQCDSWYVSNWRPARHIDF